MTDWRKYKSMPGVTYPPDGAPEYATDDKPVIKRPERDPAAKAKRQKRREQRKYASPVKFNAFGSARAHEDDCNPGMFT